MDTIPTEILIHILSFSIPSKRQRRVRRPLARVCHLWRDIIYGSPFFWTEVRLHRTTGELLEILDRNPDGPLDIIWTPPKVGKFPCWTDSRRMAMISSQSHRWRSLASAGPMTVKMRAQLLEIPTPRLINFNVIGWSYESYHIDLASPGAALSELTLRWATLDWEIPRLKGLRCLRLHDPLGNPTPTAEQLHAILSSSPGLEILDLSCWTALFDDGPRFKELGAVPLPSLTTLAAEQVPSNVLQMLLFCIQAPNCRYIRLPSINPILFQDSDILERVAKLCQGPLSTVPRLLVSYDLTSGSCVITDGDTDIQPQADAQESSIKLARRRGVYLRTERIFDPVPEGDALQSGETRLRKFITEFVQPALCNLNIEIQLDLRDKSPEETSPRPKSVVMDLLLCVPLVTHLRIRPGFHPMDVLPFLSTCQPVRTLDTEATQELSWPVPLMETLTVAYDLPDHEAVFKSLEGLISKRGPHIHHKVATASGQSDERGDGASDPPCPLKHIVMQNKNELPFKVWDSGQGWRMC